MRKISALLALLLLASSLSAQSVTISQAKWDELLAILATYGQIPPQLDKLGTQLTDLQTSFGQRINDLQTGFDQYKQEVDTVLIPKAKTLESDVFWMKLGLGGLGILAVGEGAYITGHALGWWK